jgi:hypothetical protein
LLAPAWQYGRASLIATSSQDWYTLQVPVTCGIPVSVLPWMKMTTPRVTTAATMKAHMAALAALVLAAASASDFATLVAFAARALGPLAARSALALVALSALSALVTGRAYSDRHRRASGGNCTETQWLHQTATAAGGAKWARTSLFRLVSEGRLQP